LAAGDGEVGLLLKKSYSAREVAALTGLTARQLEWWHARGLVVPSVLPRRTPAGGYTERRYSPVELYELLALAELRRRGFSVAKLRVLLETLGRRFGVRLFDTLGGGGSLTLLTDGRELYGRTATGEFYNLLRNPAQPLLPLGESVALRQLGGRTRRRRRRAPPRRPTNTA
jgi:DNA-binding transcriptional MerR regulator